MDLGFLLIILIIPLAVWILSNIFRGFEDAGPNNRRGVPPRGRGLPPGRRQPAPGDIDSFLAEINRRRREAAERQGAPPLPPPVPPQAVSAREPPMAQRRPGPRPPAPVPPSRPRPERREPRVVEVVVSEPRPSPRVPVVELVEPQQAPLEAMPVSAVPVPTAVRFPPTGRAAAPALANLATFLRSKQTLRSAILLHEILGPPRCRRR